MPISSYKSIFVLFFLIHFNCFGILDITKRFHTNSIKLKKTLKSITFRVSSLTLKIGIKYTFLITNNSLNVSEFAP